MASTISFVTSTGDFLPGMTAAVITTSCCATTWPSNSRWRLIERLVLGLGVASGVLRVCDFQRKLDEPAAQTLHLFLYGGTQIVGRDHGAEAASSGDGLQPGDACAHHQHARGSDGSGRGGQHGEDAGQRVGGDDDRLVSADRAHGGESVHALGAGGARHQLDGEGSRAGSGDFLHGLHVAERSQEADQDLAAPQKRKIGFAGDIVGAVAQHLEDDVGRAKYL